MDLQELTNLITVRQYISIAIGNAAMDRATVSELNGMLLLIDKKIISILKDNEFKEYINYWDVKNAIEEVARITNIKSGLKR